MSKGEANAVEVDPLSATSLRLQILGEHQQLATATGFSVKFDDNHYLITNYHVVSGKDYQTRELLPDFDETPKIIRIFHHGKNLGNWVAVDKELFDAKGRSKWIEHPNTSTDVVALPLESTENVTIHEFDLTLKDENMKVRPAMPVSIIGYPHGVTTSVNWPIWKTGHIASDPDLNFKEKPAFLIDATTRGGMSGSPVVVRLSGGYPTEDGGFVMSRSGFATKFLGIYSAHMKKIEIGLVWRPKVVTGILNSIN